ncbi:MAG: cation transporter [Negativicutes bacterium]|nr:cation transporter [Negativicutes bacterium]
MSNESNNKVKKVLFQILFANLFVAAAKIVIGTIIKSASMTADGFHSLTDGISNVVGLIGISLASQPVDSEHPYGHQKYEFLTSLFIGGMLLVIAAKIAFEALDRIMNPITPVFGLEAITALLLTLLINIMVCVYESSQGKQLNSTILMSDSMHTKSDIYVTVGVLLTLLGIELGAPPIIDSLASLIVGGFIVHAGIKIIKSTSDILVDKAAIDHSVIRNIALSFPQVINVHEIRSRGTANGLFVDMHIVVDPEMTIKESHELVHKIEEKLQLEINPNIEVIIHTEPNSK